MYITYNLSTGYIHHRVYLLKATRIVCMYIPTPYRYIQTGKTLPYDTEYIILVGELFKRPIEILDAPQWAF